MMAGIFKNSVDHCVRWNQSSFCSSRLASFQRPTIACVATRSFHKKPIFVDEVSQKEINEEDLYRYTRHRWIFNEEHELSKRYLRFNVWKLIEAAIATIGSPTAHCVKITKCKEGLHNKAFLLLMDDGSEVFAKLPNPNAGPSALTTVSEVATREFLQNILDIPIPKVLAWSADPENAVKAEYILEEKAPGVQLGTLWAGLPRKSRIDIISQVVDIESRLASFKFPYHGSLYFKDWFIGSDVVTKPLDSQLDGLERFVIGPCTTAKLWRATSDDLVSDRGPWFTCLDFFKAMGLSEADWIRRYARFHIVLRGAGNKLESPESVIALIEKYLTIVPFLIPKETRPDIHSATLWHPDLHRDNIFVDPTTNKITRIVDWQSAVVAPLFLQSCVPRMVRHHRSVDDDWTVPEKPCNYDALDPDEREAVDTDIQSIIHHKYYKSKTFQKNPRHWECLRIQSEIDLRTAPVRLVSNCWSKGDVFHLREALMKVIRQWDELSSDTSCPVVFTANEYIQHSEEAASINSVGEILRIFRDERVLPVDGMVDHENFERAQRSNTKFKEIFIDLGSTEEEKILHESLWPYREPRTIIKDGEKEK